MNRQKIANELVAVARELQAAAKGPVWDALKKDWNALHDIESALGDAMKEYDIAASYSGEGEKDAIQMLRAIEELKEQLESLSMRRFRTVVDMEARFVKKHGTPDEYAERIRKEIYPA